MRNLILSALILASAFQTALGQAVEGQWTYIIENGGATITASTATGAVTIPSELGGYAVKKVGNNAELVLWPSIFGAPNTSVTSVVIPAGVTSIENYAFYDCTALTSIFIPASVTSIGKDAFGYCASLASVTIGNSVTSIGDYAFYACTRLTSITIPNSVTSIGFKAFNYCSSLISITIPNSVTSIGKDAFLGCTKLVTVYLPVRFATNYTNLRLTASQVSFYGPGDDDGDGQTDLDEIIAGTDPFNPNSRLAIDTIVATPGGIILTWTAGSGRKYTVEARQDLSSGTWASVATGLTTGSYTDSSSLPPKKFYRLVVQ